MPRIPVALIYKVRPLLYYCFVLLFYASVNITSAYSNPYDNHLTNYGCNYEDNSIIHAIDRNSHENLAPLQSIARSQQASTPTIEIDSGGLQEFYAQVGGEHIQYYYVDFYNFSQWQSAFIEVNDVSGAFTISTEKFSGYSTGIEIKPNPDGYLDFAQIYVRYKPTEAADYTVPVYHNGSTAETQVLNLKGFTLVPLPLSLIHFKGSVLRSAVVLDWKAAADTELSHFEVQISRNIAAGFKTIGIVTCEPTNSVEPTNYTFTYNPGNTEPWQYYRIVQFYTNNSTFYSPVLAIKAPAIIETGIKAFPNPFHASSKLNVTAAEAGNLKVVINSVSGAEVFSSAYNVESGESQVEVDPYPGIPAGTYILTAELNGTTKRLKLVKQ